MGKQISTNPPLREEVWNHLLAINVPWWLSYLPLLHNYILLSSNWVLLLLPQAPLTLVLIFFSYNKPKVRSKPEMLRGKCIFCSLGFLILILLFPFLQARRKQMKFPFWKGTKNRCRQDSSFQSPPEGGALSCQLLLGEALMLHGKHQPINHVHRMENCF